MAILYLVATPIGTLADLSPRAREILAAVDLVICEDTRHSGKLFAHLGLSKRMESLHNQNEPQKTERLLAWFADHPDAQAALVTDAGTPAVSDPGSILVQRARESGVEIRSIPGPSSLSAALAACGFLAPRTIFSGFFPRKEGERQREMRLWKKSAPCIAVYFESPQRVCDSLASLEAGLGGQVRVCVARELSKKFEEHLVGSASELRARCADRDSSLGECVICVLIPEAAASIPDDELQAPDAGANLRTDLKPLAKKWGIPSKELYEAIQSLRAKHREPSGGDDGF